MTRVRLLCAFVNVGAVRTRTAVPTVVGGRAKAGLAHTGKAPLAVQAVGVRVAGMRTSRTLRPWQCSAEVRGSEQAALVTVSGGLGLRSGGTPMSGPSDPHLVNVSAQKPVPAIARGFVTHAAVPKRVGNSRKRPDETMQVDAVREWVAETCALHTLIYLLTVGAVALEATGAAALERASSVNTVLPPVGHTSTSARALRIDMVHTALDHQSGLHTFYPKNMTVG